MKRVRAVVVLAAVMLGVAAGGAAHAHNGAGTLDETAALETSQAVVGRTVGDYRFRDTRGNTVALSAFRGRPLVISLVYTSCAQSCPILTRNLAAVVDVAREALGGESFAVATIGFDTRTDTPARMRLYAEAQGIAGEGWTFLSADHATIEGLARGLGFTYFVTAKGFDHLAQTTVLDAEGRVYRQIYGETFPAPALVEPLKELVWGGPSEAVDFSGLVDRVRFFCTLYDPASGRYTIDYSLFIGMAIGAASLAAVGTILARGWLRQRRLGRTPG